MNIIEKDVISFLKIIGKAIFSTLLVSVASIFTITGIMGIFANSSGVEQSNLLILLSVYMGTVFSVFFCTNIILNEIRSKNS